MKDKQQLLDDLEATRTELLSAIEGLSEQWSVQAWLGSGQ